MAGSLALGAALLLSHAPSAAAMSTHSAAVTGTRAAASTTAPSPREHIPDAHPAYTLLNAAGTAEGGLNSSWTWAAVFAGISLVVALLGVIVTILHHRRDKQAQRHAPIDILLDEAAVEIDRLATLSATKTDMDDLAELRRRIKQAAKASSIPMDTVVAAIEAYERTALPDDFATRLAEGTSGEILRLSRRQGAGIEAVRAAIDAVQGLLRR
ncbi:hypothetical protein ACIBAG_33795 [Streptomyces sp. NPDC051243]|uniref:hypothetical protein n=1 Tax=Streptomyces sp. NPDC051243 TaxID=3365646 RepID=UPI0037989274